MRPQELKQAPGALVQNGPFEARPAADGRVHLQRRADEAAHTAFLQH